MMNGIGAYLAGNGMTLCILVNHERKGNDATITKINLNKGKSERFIAKRIKNEDEMSPFWNLYNETK